MIDTALTAFKSIVRPLIRPALKKVLGEDAIPQEKVDQVEAEIVGSLASVDIAQVELLKVDAKSSSFLQRMWRPGFGWTFLAIIIYNYLIRDIILIYAAFRGHDLSFLPTISTAWMYPMIAGMLGVSASRTYEKMKKVDTKE